MQLYDILGFDKFFEVLTYFSARSFKFPKIDKIKKLLIVSIAYYQTEVLGLTAKDAGKILSEKLGLFNLKQKSIKSLVSKVQQDIDHLATTVANRQSRQEVETSDDKLDVIKFKEENDE